MTSLPLWGRWRRRRRMRCSFPLSPQPYTADTNTAFAKADEQCSPLRESYCFLGGTGSSRTSTPTDSGSHSLLPLTDCFLPFLPMRSYPQSKKSKTGGVKRGRQRGFVNFFAKKFTNIQNQHCGSHGLSTRGLSSLPFAWWFISSCAPAPVWLWGYRAGPHTPPSFQRGQGVHLQVPLGPPLYGWMQ